MNSSGIKRGLATTAVSALAIAGLPLFASSASAATGDSITVASVSPVRDGGNQGAVILLQTKNITASALRLAATNLTDRADSLTQDVAIVGTQVASAGDFTDSNLTDGLDEIRVRVTVSSGNPAGGASYAFALYEDEDNGQTTLTGADLPDRDSTEAFGQVSGTTSGAPVRIATSPSLRSTPVNTLSAPFTGTLQDAAGRTTQLTGTEEIRFSEVSGPGAVTFDPTGPLSATDVGSDGQFDFAAKSTVEGLTVLRAGAYPNNTVPGTESFGANVNLDVSGAPAADDSIQPTEVDVQTGADNRAGFNQTSNTVQVRQDQNTVTFAIKDVSQKNKIVTLKATSGTVTFNGKADQTQTVTLDNDGIGSVTFTVDAGSIQTGDSFKVDGPVFDDSVAPPAGFPADGFTINYVGSSIAAADGGTVDADQTVYLSSFGGTVNPIVTVKDQFGQPATNAYVTYTITSGPDAGTESARVKTDDKGQVTFSITDTKATTTNQADGGLLFKVYKDAFDPSFVSSDAGSRIDYSADGQGADFLISVDGQVPGGAVYNPTVLPLTDAVANLATETATVAIAGGTPNAAATVTVDGGALILDGGTTLDKGKASVTRTVGDTFEIIGTKEGVVNITVTSGGKTKTGTVTVKAADNNSAEARNIELEGPDGAVAGDVVEFTATITDAFGNPVTGFDDANIDERITGPGNFQGTSGDSDANGEIVYSVEITQGASNPVTLRLEATGAQFGAKANELTDANPATAAPGLTASVDSASATVDVVDIDALEAAVAQAEADLAAAQADLAAAQGNLDVATTELAVAQANVDSLQAKKAELRKKLNKAKENGNKQKAKTTRKKLRAVKRNLAAAQDQLTIASAKVAAAQGVVDQREDQVAAAEEALAQAQADLEEAQN